MKSVNWRYAIGELLIVITGISIAFALNSWASSIKDKDLKKEYLSSIKGDLTIDVQHLDSNCAELEMRIKYFQRMFAYMGREIPGKDSVAMGMFRFVDPVDFTPRETTLQSMKFSGDLKLINDLELKNTILNHYEKYGDVETQLERHVVFAKEHLADYFMRNIDYSRLGTGKAEFMDDPYFKNLMFSLYGIYLMEKESQQKALASAQKLLEEFNGK